MNWQDQPSPTLLKGHPAGFDHQQSVSLLAMLTTLEQTVNSLSTTVSELNSTIQKQEEDLANTEARLSQSESTISELRENLESSIEKQESLKLELLSSRVDKMDLAMNKLRTESIATTEELFAKATNSDSNLENLRKRLDESESSMTKRLQDLDSVVQNQHCNLENAVICLRDSKSDILATSTALETSVLELKDRSTRLQQNFHKQRDEIDIVTKRLRQYEDGEIANFGLMDAITDIIADATANGIQTLTDRAMEATTNGVRTLKERAAEISDIHFQDSVRCYERTKKSESYFTVQNTFSSALAWVLLLL